MTRSELKLKIEKIISETPLTDNEDSVKAIMELIPDWISVNERLPEVGQYVLCLREGFIPDSFIEECGAFGYFKYGIWGNTENDNWNVTHWQPLLPKPDEVNRSN